MQFEALLYWRKTILAYVQSSLKTIFDFEFEQQKSCYRLLRGLLECVKIFLLEHSLSKR